MTSYVIRIDGETGTLFVDGEEPQPFGKVVSVEVKHPLPRPLTADLNPYTVHAAERPVVEVTLRLPLGLDDTLTILRGPQIEDVRGPSGDATVVPSEYFDELVADLEAALELNERMREAARLLRDVVRRPEVEEHELILRNNPELVQQVREGVEEAEAEQAAHLGSFAQYLDDEEEPGA